jgi:hypothetical protein
MECMKPVWGLFANYSFKRTIKYKLAFVRVQEVRCDSGDTEPAGKYTFFYGMGMKIIK